MEFQVRQLAVGGFDQNFSYLVTAENGDAALVDPTGDAEIIRRAVEAAGAIVPRYILLTHGHLDHHQALGEAEGFFPAPVVAHPTNPMAGKFHLRDRQILPFGTAGIEALFTPGHSRDSVCYRLTDNSAIFTGDVLFVGCIGFCRSRDMYRSLTRKILPLDDRLVVYSGHDYGPVPFRTLGEEKRENPFLNCPDLETFQSLLQHIWSESCPGVHPPYSPWNSS